MEWYEDAGGFFTQPSIGEFLGHAKGGIALMMGLFLKINGTSSRVMAILSNASVCVSGRTVERLKKRISNDAIQYAVELVASRHQNSMIHATNCAVIAIDEEGIDVPKGRPLSNSR